MGKHLERVVWILLERSTPCGQVESYKRQMPDYTKFKNLIVFI